MNVSVVPPIIDEHLLLRAFSPAACSLVVPAGTRLPKVRHEIHVPANKSGKKLLSTAYGYKLRLENNLDHWDHVDNINYYMHIDPETRRCINTERGIMEAPFWGAFFGPSIVNFFLQRLKTPEPNGYQEDKWLCPNDLIRCKFTPAVGKTEDDAEVAGIVLHTLRNVACRYVNIADTLYDMQCNGKAGARKSVAALKKYRYSLKRVDLSLC